MKEKLSFNDRVTLAIEIVKAFYPNALLREANGISPRGPTTDPDWINQLEVIFSNDNNTSIFIREIAYGEFGHPQLIEILWIENDIISWPIEMDLDRANELKEIAGYKEPYETVTLYKPSNLNPCNPCFIFNTYTTANIFVDTVTGETHL